MPPFGIVPLRRRGGNRHRRSAAESADVRQRVCDWRLDAGASRFIQRPLVALVPLAIAMVFTQRGLGVCKCRWR